MTGEAMKPKVNNSIDGIFLGTSHTPMVYFWAHITPPNGIFLGTFDTPILHIRWVGISITRRKGWKAQICGKGKTPKWALVGGRVTRPWPLPDVDGKMMALMSHFVTYPINHQWTCCNACSSSHSPIECKLSLWAQTLRWLNILALNLFLDWMPLLGGIGDLHLLLHLNPLWLSNRFHSWKILGSLWFKVSYREENF